MLAVVEAVSLFAIIRLWRKKKLSVARRIAWSFLLLIPVFGPLMYGFVSLVPAGHGEDAGDFSSGGGGGGGALHDELIFVGKL